MGKTETIKKRRVDVYLRSEEQKEHWNRFANGKKTSLSKVIKSTMESFIDGGLMEQLDAKENLTKKNQALSEEIEQLKTTYRRQERYIELLETELNRTKPRSFTNPGPGVRHYDKDLIQILKESRGPVSNNDILRRAKVDISGSITEYISSLNGSKPSSIIQLRLGSQIGLSLFQPIPLSVRR
jgi:hypothetical protein